MASDASSQPSWVSTPPAAFDIVSCYYPETEPQPDGEFKLRPTLVLKVFQSDDGYACEVAFGTKNLKIPKRQGWDLIVQNAGDMNQFGLYHATRFDLDNIEMLVWTPEFFGCWKHRTHPKLGSLTFEYIREYAYLMMRRSQVPG